MTAFSISARMPSAICRTSASCTGDLLFPGVQLASCIEHLLRVLRGPCSSRKLRIRNFAAVRLPDAVERGCHVFFVLTPQAKLFAGEAGHHPGVAWAQSLLTPREPDQRCGIFSQRRLAERDRALGR